MKKFVSLILSFCLMFVGIVPAFAANTNSSYTEAVDTLTALNILVGDDKGDLNLDSTITRAEFSTLIVRLLGMEDAAKGVAIDTIFSDVPATHWASGYVKIANQKEIIAGYGDGTFGPEDPVTYEQAIKMLVCALGYAPMFADVKDAYPTSYMAQANTLGMTVGAAGKIGDKATRGVVAKLIYNALDDKIMEQTSFGSDKEYGIPMLYSTPLSKYLKVGKVEAEVKPVSFAAEDADKVHLTINGYDTVAYRDVVFSDGDYEAVEGLSIFKDYNVIVYIDYNDDDMKVIGITPKAGKNETLTITSTQMKDGILDLANNKLSYYKISSDLTSKATDEKLDTNIKIYRNNDVDVWSDDISADYAAGELASITLINNDNDNAWDTLLFTKVISDIITDVYYGSEAVSTKDHGAFDFDKETENQTYVLTDSNSKELKFSDIRRNDILNVIESTDGKNNYYYEYIISKDVVEGTVAEISNDGKIAYINNEEYTIGGISIKPGDRGIFYIDITGKILEKELDTSSRDFGILYAVYSDNKGADTETKAVIYTSKGKFEDVEFAKNVRIGANTYASSNFKVENDKLYSGSDEIIDVTNGIVIAYSTNSSDAINELIISGNVDDYKYVPKTTDKYDATDATIDNLFVNKDTVIVTNTDANNISNVNAKDNYAIGSESMFADDETYTIEYIYDENNDTIVYMIVYGARAKVNATNNVMYVSSNTAEGQTSDGDPYKIVKGYVDGELTSFNIDDNTYIYYAKDNSTLTVNDITKGAIVQYNKDTIVKSVRVIATAADIASGNISYGEDYRDEETGYMISGKVEKYSNGIIYFANAEKLTFKSDVKAVKVIMNGSEIDRIYTGYNISNAETAANVGEGNNDDIVIVYNYDRNNLACVIIDIDNDNKK